MLGLERPISMEYVVSLAGRGVSATKNENLSWLKVIFSGRISG